MKTHKTLILSAWCLFFLTLQPAYGLNKELTLSTTDREIQFERGVECEKLGDYPMALRWYKRSSSSGNSKARKRMFDQDFQYIISMFNCALSKDSDLESYPPMKRALAQRSLGLMFFYGNYGAPQDTAKALYWFGEAAKNSGEQRGQVLK